eukprot:989397-Lingulodinium_polyedra.AAC.1
MAVLRPAPRTLAPQKPEEDQWQPSEIKSRPTPQNTTATPNASADGRAACKHSATTPGAKRSTCNCNP